MLPPTRIRFARAPAIFAALENVKLDSQRRSRSECVETAATVFLNRADRCPVSHMAKSERRRFGRAWMPRPGAARLPVATALRPESRPLEIAQRCGRSSAARLQYESLGYFQRDRKST